MSTIAPNAKTLTLAPWHVIMRVLGIDPNMTTNLIGEKLKEIREAGGVSAVDLAEKLGVKKSILSHYEAGRRRMPDGFVERYITAVQELVRERAKAVGIL